jgi:hypothetical protein
VKINNWGNFLSCMVFVLIAFVKHYKSTKYLNSKIEYFMKMFLIIST